MLLPSERHSPADLDWWKRQHLRDYMHGGDLSRSHRPESAMADIRDFSDSGPCYMGTSWGKDSVVALHLLVLSGASVPVVHIVQDGPHKDPDQHRVRDAFLSRWSIDYHEIIVEDRGVLQHETGHAPGLDAGIKEAQARFGKRWISGLRADESGVRKLSARKGLRDSCWPIKWWTAQDVYGWLVLHDLPIHPAYAMTRGGTWDREQIRVSIIGGQKGRGLGRLDWEQHYYPDIIDRLRAEGRLHAAE